MVHPFNLYFIFKSTLFIKQVDMDSPFILVKLIFCRPSEPHRAGCT